MFQVDLDTS